MGSVAQFQQFGPFLDSSGALVTAPHIYHYSAGTSTLKDAYADRGKLATVAQPIVGGATGVASAYWDGVYKLVVKTSDEATTLFTWDNVDMTVDEQRLEGSLIWTPGSPGALFDANGDVSSGITVTGAAFGDYVDVAAPYSTQGCICTAWVDSADTIKIRVQNETTSSKTFTSGTWTVRVRKA